MPDDAQLATVERARNDAADPVASPAACAVAPRACTIDARGLQKRFADQVVLWRLRYKLSLRDLAEMFLERGFAFTHEAVRDWEARFAPLLAEHLRAKRRGQAGASWYVDET